jgi:hypothetical protein
MYKVQKAKARKEQKWLKLDLQIHGQSQNVITNVVLAKEQRRLIALNELCLYEGELKNPQSDQYGNNYIERTRDLFSILPTTINTFLSPLL